MTTLCARLGCGRAASVAFVFDSHAQTVWLDPYREGRPGAGLLCDRHADRLTPPRGWHLQDRRPAAPRLWSERPVLATSRPDRKRARATSVCGGVATVALPFAAEEAPGADGGAGDEQGPAWPRRGEQDPALDPLLDARSPLLARAFQPVRRA